MNAPSNQRRAAAIHVASVAALNTLLSRDSAPSPLVIATIVPGARWCGYARFKEPAGHLLTAAELRQRILISLAGEIAVSELTSTADGEHKIQTDRLACFERSVRLCVNFVALTEPQLIGDEHRMRVFTVLLELVEEARQIIHNNAPKLLKVADALLVQNTITQRDLNALLI